MACDDPFFARQSRHVLPYPVVLQGTLSCFKALSTTFSAVDFSLSSSVSAGYFFFVVILYNGKSSLVNL